MRTTLTVDDDVLAAARQLADAEHTSVGTALSRLARSGLQPTTTRATRSGLVLLPEPGRQVSVTDRDVAELRDEPV